jgi:hypothetical protein
MIGKLFSNGWKIRPGFSNDWKKSFQWLEKFRGRIRVQSIAFDCNRLQSMGFSARRAHRKLVSRHSSLVSGFFLLAPEGGVE